MTISLRADIPVGKAARVVRSDGSESTFNAGTNVSIGAVYNGASIDKIEEVEATSGGATTQGGGNGNGPPDPGT